MRRSAVLSPPLAALAALLGLAPSARAADVPYILHGPRCPLPYTPYTQELATAPELVCRLDADDDGIDDAIENLVAECFMPMFRFDTAENALRTWPAPAGAPPGSAATEEPRAVFSVDPVLPGASVPVPSAARRRAQVKYTFLWDRDAGWHRLEGPAAEVPAQSRDAHLGDS